MRTILDICAFLWLVSDAKELSEQAIEHDLTLLTSDQLIMQYPVNRPANAT